MTLGHRLQAALRPDDTAARLGGDEFAVLLEHTVERDARVVADRLLASLAEPVVIGEHAVHVTVSLGIATNVGDAHVKADDVLRDADLAMYSAKSSAPGTYAVYEPAMYEQALQRLEERVDEEPRAKERRRPTATWEPSVTVSLKASSAAT